MARGSAQATAGATQAQNTSAGLSAKGNGIFSSLVPQLQAQAANPQGFSPTSIAGMDTAAMQGAGGATAGATGRGALLAGRTNNAGAAAKAISDAARTGGEQLSMDRLGVENENEQLKAKQQQQGLAGLEGLYGTDVSGANTAQGEVAPLINADTEAKNASYDWITKGVAPILGAASQGAGAFAKGCWIAEAIYGVDDWRTHTVREWLNGPFRQTFTGSLVMDAYLAVGRQVAWVARRSSVLRRILKPLFDKALRAALREGPK